MTLKQHCEVCESETEWTRAGDGWAHDFCNACGYSKEMLAPDNYPGGCKDHPGATHEQGYGLAGVRSGVYSVCNECGAVFDKFQDPEMM